MYHSYAQGSEALSMKRFPAHIWDRRQATHVSVLPLERNIENSMPVCFLDTTVHEHL